MVNCALKSPLRNWAFSTFRRDAGTESSKKSLPSSFAKPASKRCSVLEFTRFTWEKTKTQLYYTFFGTERFPPPFVLLYRMEFCRKNITHKDPLAKGQSAFEKQNLLHHLDEFMVFIMFAFFFLKKIFFCESIWVEFPATKSINTSSLSWPWLKKWIYGTYPLTCNTFLRWKIFESLWPYGPFPNRVGRKRWKKL